MIKNFDAAQRQYDNMSDEEPEVCPECGKRVEVSIMGNKQCKDREYCGWIEQGDG